MSYFVITDYLSNISTGRYTNLEAAHHAALRVARADGATELLSIYTKLMVQVCTSTRQPLVTARLSTAVTDSLSASPKAAVAALARPKPLKFIGRPSVSGWFKSPDKVELDIDATLATLPNLNEREYWLIYMAASGRPVLTIPIVGVDAEVTAILRSDKRGHVRPADVACAMALACMAPTAPAEAVALFVVRPALVTKAGATLAVAGKRLLSTARLTTYVSPAPKPMDLASAWGIKPDDVVDKNAADEIAFQARMQAEFGRDI